MGVRRNKTVLEKLVRWLAGGTQEGEIKPAHKHTWGYSGGMIIDGKAAFRYTCSCGKEEERRIPL
jgi:hypothetical protein